MLEGGGGFQDVGTLNEGLASGVPFVEAGYNVFSVKYRAEFTEVVPGQPNNVTAVQDLGRAMQFIFDNAGPDKLFDIDPEHYALGGFSAGSFLAHSWAVEGVGFDQYGIPAPELMILSLVFMTLALWVSFVSGPRVDTMTQGNIGLFWALCAIMALLCVWRAIAYVKFSKRMNAQVG